MPREEIDTLMAELQAWVDQAEFGAQKKLADSLGVPSQRLNHWIRGRKLPNLKDGLKLQTFLQAWRKNRARVMNIASHDASRFPRPE
jgi:predicted XRE-type DNA-binding protein